jgi:hypothetical protein
MADQFAVLELVIDQELDALKRTLLQDARSRMTAGTEDLGLVQATVEVDLDAVLRNSTSARMVKNVARDDGPQE